MSLVLAIEPDRLQADILREVHATLGVRLSVVSSKDDAIAAIDDEVPDLILVNALLSPREEVDLVAHLRSLDGLAHLQLLTIPRLARAKRAPAPAKSPFFGFGKKKRAAAPPPEGCEPSAFAEQITSYLARANEVKQAPKPRVPPPPAVRERRAPAERGGPDSAAATVPAMAAAETAPLYEPPAGVPAPEPAVAASFDAVAAPGAAVEPPAVQAADRGAGAGEIEQLFDRLGFTPHDAVPPAAPLQAARHEAAMESPPEAQAESEVLIDLDTVVESIEAEPRVAAAALAAPVAEAVPERPIGDTAPATAAATPAIDLEEVRAQAEAALAAELARVQAEAAEQRQREIERVQAEAAERRERELAHWQAEAEALREATVGRARAEAEAKAREALAEELARTRAVSEQARHEEIARLQAEADERLAEVTQEARRVAEAEAARAFTEELARVRAESEVAAARSLDNEVARVRAEADARLQAELERVRREAEEARRAEQAAAQAEAERMREAAAREAREVAEAAAARALEAEVARIRAEADAVRAAAEARLAEESKAHAEASQAIAEAERVRETAAREAREIAEAAAAKKLDVELRRVREEAEARLAAQSEAQVKAELLREAAAREAQAIAEAAATQKLEIEIRRVRADADARLSAELAQLREDAERRREAELEEIRRQVDEMRVAAAEQARSAASEAVAAEVARAAALRPPEPPAPRVVPLVRAADAPAPAAAAPEADTPPVETEEAEAVSSYYDLWRAEGSPPLAGAEPAPWTRSVPGPFRRKRWMLPAAAAALLVACGSIGISVDAAAWAASARKALASAIPVPGSKPEAEAAPAPPSTGDLLVETTPKGARVTVDGTPRGTTPMTVTALSPGKHKLTLESSDGVIIRREVTIRAGERAFSSELMVSGWLTVFSRIPVDVLLEGKRIGTSGDQQIMLSPGRHKVTLVNRKYNIRETQTIDIRAGSMATHTVALPTGSLNVQAPSGADVLVDGERVGEAPLQGAPIAVGTREILVRHHSFGERRQTVEVRKGTVTTVSVASDASQTGDSFNGLKVLSESAANPGVRKPRP